PPFAVALGKRPARPRLRPRTCRCLLPSVLSSRLARRRLAERGLGGREAGDGHAERRARDIAEGDRVAESDPGRGAAVLAANAHFELWPRLAAAFDADAHQFPHAIAVDGHEGIARKDAARQVSAEKARGVVAADAVGGLRQIVGAEGKELRALRDF